MRKIEDAMPPWEREEAGGSAGGVTPTPVPFDDETLGGHIDYSTIINPIPHLRGELNGLFVRYNPTAPPLPTPTGATGSVQANA